MKSFSSLILNVTLQSSSFCDIHAKEREQESFCALMTDGSITPEAHLPLDIYVRDNPYHSSHSLTGDYKRIPTNTYAIREKRSIKKDAFIYLNTQNGQWCK